MENPRNQSHLNTEGELPPLFKDSFLFRDSEGNLFYQLSKEPKKQFVVAQLASLILPVAIPYMREVDGKLEFFSPDAKRHPDSINEDGTITETSLIDNAFLNIIFNDNDHFANGWNTAGAVFYDFNSANFGEYINTIYINEVKNIFPEYMPELIKKIQKFKKEIEGEKGLEFITAVVNKAKFTENTPEEIQQVLLKRCDYFSALLAR